MEKIVAGSPEKVAVELIEREQRFYREAYEKALTEEGLQLLMSGELTIEGGDLDGWKPLSAEVLVYSISRKTRACQRCIGTIVSMLSSRGI